MDFDADGHRARPDGASLEVSLFGPGIGECVVLHLGDGTWAVVDSCVNRVTRRPIALDYLEALGVDVAAQVALVVATHFHDDHIRGLSEIVSAARSARLVVSQAVQAREFLELVAASKRHVSATHSSGLDELRWSLDALDPPVPTYAISNRPLYSRELAGCQVDVLALSPSDAAVTRAIQSLGRLVPDVGRPMGRSLPNPGPNEASVVLWVRSGSAQALLGSDLETSPREDVGWTAIVESADTPTGAHTYKVAHHGSPNAHHAGIWTKLCVQQPVAVLTPYLSGVRPLPARADIDRLRSSTPHLYCASDPRSRSSPPRRSKVVEKTIGDRPRRVLTSRMGQVRIRMPLAGGTRPTITLFGAACDLGDRGTSA